MTAKLVRALACIAALAGVTLALDAPAALAQPADVSGVWTTEHGDARIRIAPCGGSLCGTIVWLAQPLDSAGRPKADVNNPDPARRLRALVGLVILTGLKPDGQRWRGVIYNADDGRDYDVSVSLLDARRAAVRGCVLGGLFCGGETWTKD